MKVTLSPPAGAVIRVVLTSGETIPHEHIKSIEIEPFFSAHNGSGEIVHAEASNAHGDVLNGYSLIVSGANGKTKMIPRASKSVVPLIDRPKAQPKTKPASTEAAKK